MDREYIARGRKKYGHLLNEPGIRDIFPPIRGQTEEPRKSLDSEVPKKI